MIILPACQRHTATRQRKASGRSTKYGSSLFIKLSSTSARPPPDAVCTLVYLQRPFRRLGVTENEAFRSLKETTAGTRAAARIFLVK